MSSKRISSFLFVILILLILPLRMIHPSADPPSTLSMSGGPFGDPGGYSYNARNKIVFGKWELDKMNTMYISPIPHLFTYLSFKFFGVGFIQMNLVPIFFSSLLLIFAALALKNRLNGLTASVGLLLLGTNYLFTMYSRVANRIMPMIFFLILALLFFQMALKNKKWYFLAGFSCLLSFITKSVNFYVLIAFTAGFLVFMVLHSKPRDILSSLGYFLLGVSIPLIIYLAFIYLPHSYALSSLAKLNRQYLIPPRSIPKMLEYFWTRPSILLKNMPVVSFLSSIYFLIFLFRMTQRPKKIDLLNWIMIFWFAGGFFYFSIIYQRVTRHFIPQIIPMVFLSAYAIEDFLSSGSITKPKKPRLVFGMALFIWLLFPVSKLLKPVLVKLPAFFSDIWISTLILAFLSSVLAAVLFQLIKSWPKDFELSLSPALKRVTVSLILLTALVFNGHKYLSWALHPQFKMKQVSTDLGKAFDKAAIAGLWSPVICLENKHRAHEFFPGYINDDKDFLEKFKITHVFATTIFGENRDYWRYFPETMKRAKLLSKYFIWRTSVLLYELNPSPEHLKDENGYEAEIYTQPQGMPRYDSDASEKFAVHGEKNKPGLIVVASSDEKISPGKYTISFRIKKDSLHPDTTSRIIRIDAVSKVQKRVLRFKNLFDKDFAQDKKYDVFTLTVYLRRPLKLDFRVYSDGLTDIWVDNIRVEKTP